MRDQPWFKFYAADYLLDAKVDAMPREAEALLVRMWCICHREGCCPADPEGLARKTLCSSQYVLQCKQHCEPFFELQDGKLYSRRMQEEKQRSETARKNANERWKQRESKPESESQSERGNANGIANSSAKHPSLEDVRAYCAARRNSVDPQQWFDYYEANGWNVGRNPMKDWRAAVRTWERNGYGNGNGNRAERQQASNLAALEIAKARSRSN